ncbi:hypothetical protein PMX66_00300 [Collinsella aerofaciens]|uniref:hypothetical protein n=1 Tax=Collinsella aerofaciens TaxID=74426 RepID=UPI00232BC32D|nr:hypothetical protein [Collinsella aerofaciens]MDB1876595.1 hypothetical protein [Collinsella aerofaciens]
MTQNSAHTGKLYVVGTPIANQLASFAPAAGWFFQTWKTEKRIAAWDARAALGTLERGMIE